MSCLFCKIIAKEIPAKIIYEDDDLMVFDDVSPRAPIHKLIIPKKHIATLNHMSPEDTVLLGKLFFTAQKIANDLGIAEDGYRTVINCNQGAGQTVFHLHVHLLGGRLMQWPPG
jgi:histidine triad (HIT) family protein